MFAIIRVGGKQYRVENGTQVLVDRLHVEPGAPVENVEVLMVVDGDQTQIGAPTLEVAVGATAVRHHLGKKIRVFKYKAKKNYRRRIGSRPHQTLIRIDSIGGNSQRNQSAPQAVPIAEPIEAAPIETTPVETAPAPVEAAASASEAETTETTEVVEAVAVIEAPSEAAAVEAMEEIPGVESVEVVENTEDQA